jgi:SAM-dependent methyltransferase
MRTLRLGRTFDAVFAHDALCYMLTEEDLRAVFRTARAHLRPGGVLLLAPDYFVENFEPVSEEGGGDEGDRALRYLGWAWQPAGATERYVVDYAIFTREGDAAPVLHHDRHEEGLFPRAQWIAWLEAEGFWVEVRPWRHPEVDRALMLLRARWEGVG